MVNNSNNETAVTRLFLIRHCQSVGNLLKVFQGQTEFDVSPLGEKQLALLGLSLRNETIDAIYSSPLLRAWKTAEAINEYHGLDIIPLDELKEIDIGKLAGRESGKTFEGYPELAYNWANARNLCAFPGGESASNVWSRAESALKRVLSECSGRTAAIVSHGFLLQCMICLLKYGDISMLQKCHVGDNTSVSEFLISDNGAEIVRLNDSSHLPSVLNETVDYNTI